MALPTRRGSLALVLSTLAMSHSPPGLCSTVRLPPSAASHDAGEEQMRLADALSLEPSLPQSCVVPPSPSPLDAGSYVPVPLELAPNVIGEGPVSSATTPLARALPILISIRSLTPPRRRKLGFYRPPRLRQAPAALEQEHGRLPQDLRSRMVTAGGLHPPSLKRPMPWTQRRGAR